MRFPVICPAGRWAIPARPPLSGKTACVQPGKKDRHKPYSYWHDIRSGFILARIKVFSTYYNSPSSLAVSCRSGVFSVLNALKRFLVGEPLRTSQAAHERLSKRVALAVFSSDALEPRVKAANNTMGLCIEEELQRFRLRVSGNSGYNHFVSGAVAHAQGSSCAPPVATATR
jgi:hypothetical protein